MWTLALGSRHPGPKAILTVPKALQTKQALPPLTSVKNSKAQLWESTWVKSYGNCSVQYLLQISSIRGAQRGYHHHYFYFVSVLFFSIVYFPILTKWHTIPRLPPKSCLPPKNKIQDSPDVQVPQIIYPLKSRDSYKWNIRYSPCLHYSVTDSVPFMFLPGFICFMAYFSKN